MTIRSNLIIKATPPFSSGSLKDTFFGAQQLSTTTTLQHATLGFPHVAHIHKTVKDKTLMLTGQQQQQQR
jgi:hypothetical protein